MQVQRDILSNINWPDFLNKTLSSSYGMCLPEECTVTSNLDSPEYKLTCPQQAALHLESAICTTGQPATPAKLSKQS